MNSEEHQIHEPASADVNRLAPAEACVTMAPNVISKNYDGTRYDRRRRYTGCVSYDGLYSDNVVDSR